jgi:hypothetical protein
MKSITSKIMFMVILISCVGCTYTITMVHTQGEATDVVDETSSADGKVDASIPLIK